MVSWVCAVVLSVLSPTDAHPPVVGAVVEQFRAPSCPRCAGRRGVVIATEDDAPIWAVRSGVVSFVGSVARQNYVVVEIAPGVKVTYGWVKAAVVAKGQMVARGQLLARAGSRTYLGVRLKGLYVEPLRALGLSGSRLVGPGWVSPVSLGRSLVGSRPVSR